MGWVRDNPSDRSKAASEAPAPGSDEELAEILDGLTVAEVIELVESGQADLADVIAAESAGRSRKTVLALIISDSGKVYAKHED